MGTDVYSPGSAIGSTDWNGGAAPAGGTHTGRSVLMMVDGATFVVAHSQAEVEAKIAPESMPPVPAGGSAWVAFDVPDSAVPIILDAYRVRGFQGPPGSEPVVEVALWSPDLLWGNFLWGEGT